MCVIKIFVLKKFPTKNYEDTLSRGCCCPVGEHTTHNPEVMGSTCDQKRGWGGITLKRIFQRNFSESCQTFCENRKFLDEAVLGQSTFQLFRSF